MKSIQFNAHHSPVGAFASLTLGFPGAKGGLGHELKGPADEPFYVGLEEADREGYYQALPFFEAAEDKSADYDVEGHNAEFSYPNRISHFPWESISRQFAACMDEWSAGDLKFRVITPYPAVPDPTLGDSEGLKNAICPGVLIEVEVDNSLSQRVRKVFLGYAGSDRYDGVRVIDQKGLVGVGQGVSVALATNEPGFKVGVAWRPEMVINSRQPDNEPFLIGSTGILWTAVPPGEKRTYRFAAGFFREGTATTGIKARYLYRRFFNSIEEVLNHTLSRADSLTAEAKTQDASFATGLSEDRAFMHAHAVRSYYGATELLEREDGSPLWVVNEGEYRMMNTLDLTIDQLFFELKMNPWTVRNELDLFVERYAYEDTIQFPGDDTKYPGGLSFSHDMGVSNNFSSPGNSSYEQGGLKGCFSYMTAEQLLNWSICASVYGLKTGDFGWLKGKRETLKNCLASMLNRDNPDPAQRNGVISLDSSRCFGGAEITTYDSLDVSLGQARNNLYLAVKGWAAYKLIAKVFADLGLTQEAKTAAEQAAKAEATILAAVDTDGTMPAIIGEGVPARLIPAIEGLVYLDYLCFDLSDSKPLVEALKNHLTTVLTKGVCKFEEGGWKLSSTSDNSWLSKIYLCQAIAENILGFAPDLEADKAHVNWLLDPANAYFAWSDQMLAGKACGSRYYPRGVTSTLWLSE
ncbi:MAG: glycoside hydrolase family 52 protein [Armatimonadota bacterium]